MIRPIDALAPKVLFKGQPNSSDATRTTAKRLALINAAGISIVTGAVTTAAARSYTSCWKHAGLYGVFATFLSMMFLAPRFLYKSGFYTNKGQDAKVMKEPPKLRIPSNVKSVLRRTA